MSDYLFPNYGQRDITMVEGKGSYLFDEAGKQYLDFISGIAVCNLGHCHPLLVKAIQQQATKLWHTSNLFRIPTQEKLAEILCEATGMGAAFFCNSGAEANEAAIKLARKWSGKHHIITFQGSFHGRTMATLSATGQEKIHAGFGPLVSKFSYAKWNNRESVESAYSDETAAVMIEVVQGEGGVRTADRKWLQWLSNWCESKNILLIVDEVQTGMGRTGNAFAFQKYGIRPHVVTMAKGLGGGFPIGAMIARKELRDVLSPGSHGSTFGGNPLATAVAVEVASFIFNPLFLDAVEKKGSYFLQLLQDIKKESSIVKECRGLGLMIGIECTEEVAPFIATLKEKGLLVVSAGPKVIRCLPPLTVSYVEIEEAVAVLANVLKESVVSCT